MHSIECPALVDLFDHCIFNALLLEQLTLFGSQHVSFD